MAEKPKSAPVGIDWNGFRNSDLFEVGGAVPFGRRSCPAERQGAGALDFPAARKFVKSILPDWFHSTPSRNVARKRLRHPFGVLKKNREFDWAIGRYIGVRQPRVAGDEGDAPSLQS